MSIMMQPMSYNGSHMIRLVSLHSTPKNAKIGDQSYHMGAIVARRLHHNRHNGDFFGGIYATRLGHFLEIDIREGDMELPPAFLDYDAMVSHHFLVRNEQFL